MKHRHALIVCVFLAVNLVAASLAIAGEQKNRTAWASTNPSSMKLLNNDEAVIENHIYLYTKCYQSKSQDTEHFVVSQKSKWHIGPWEGNDPLIEATGLIIANSGKERKLWRISERADEGYLSCNFYRTVWYGCCTASPNNRLFNIKTGQIVNEYNRDLLSIRIPNSPIERYIGYKTGETIHHYPWETHKKHIGTITYSSTSNILHRLIIRGRGDNYEDKFGFGRATMSFIPGNTDQELNGKTTLELWAADGSDDPKQITGFKIKLEFDAISVQIPIKADAFFCEKTVFPDFEFVSIHALD